MRSADKAQRRLEPWNVDLGIFCYVDVRNKLASQRSEVIYTGKDGALIHIGSWKDDDHNPPALRLFLQKWPGDRGVKGLKSRCRFSHS